MKKFIASMTLLVLIVLFGLLSIGYIKKSSDSLVDIIDDTQKLVNSGGWDSAKGHIDNLEEKWSKTDKKWGVLIDHYEMDNIEMSLIKSKEYIDTNDLPLATAELSNLKYMVEHIYEKEVFNLKNVF